MADRCSCLQCRILRECYGPGQRPTSGKAFADTIAALVPVLAYELSHCDEPSVQHTLDAITHLRAGYLAQREGDGPAEAGLGGMEVAGHG